jgi:hypothetical protein
MKQPFVLMQYIAFLLPSMIAPVPAPTPAPAKPPMIAPVPFFLLMMAPVAAPTQLNNSSFSGAAPFSSCWRWRC